MQLLVEVLHACAYSAYMCHASVMYIAFLESNTDG